MPPLPLHHARGGHGPGVGPGARRRDAVPDGLERRRLLLDEARGPHAAGRRPLELVLELLHERLHGLGDVRRQHLVGPHDDLGDQLATAAGHDLVPVGGGEGDREEGHDDAHQPALREPEQEPELVVEGGEMDGVDRPGDHPEHEPHGERRAHVDGEHRDQAIPGGLLAHERGQLAAEPQGQEAAGGDAGDPGDLPDDALEIAQRRGRREDAEHHEVVAFDRHGRRSPMKSGRGVGRESRGQGRRPRSPKRGVCERRSRSGTPWARGAVRHAAYRPAVAVSRVGALAPVFPGCALRLSRSPQAIHLSCALQCDASAGERSGGGP